MTIALVPRAVGFPWLLHHKAAMASALSGSRFSGLKIPGGRWESKWLLLPNVNSASGGDVG